MTSQAEDLKVSDCRFEEKDVGKAFKSTKRKFRWEFKINGNSHFVELYDSKLSGKKKVIADGHLVLEPKVIRSLFTYSFFLDSHTISLVQNGQTFECRINNLPFGHLQELQKNQKVFTKNGTSPVSAVFVSTDIPGSKFQLKTSQDILGTDKNENKENYGSNKQGVFSIKPVEKEDSSSLPLSSKFDFKKMDEIYSKTSQHAATGINLLDFEFDKKPTKVNILDLSLHENKGEVETNTSKQNGNDSEEKHVIGNKNNKTAKTDSSDINDIFDNIKLYEPPKEVSKVEKIKEIYNSKFTENEASKIDKIYNLFGGPSFSIEYNKPVQSFSPLPSQVLTRGGSFKNLPSDFSLKEEKNESNSTNSTTHKYVCNLYPSFENSPFKNDKSSPQPEMKNKNKDLFDLFN